MQRQRPSPGCGPISLRPSTKKEAMVIASSLSSHYLFLVDVVPRKSMQMNISHDDDGIISGRAMYASFSGLHIELFDRKINPFV